MSREHEDHRDFEIVDFRRDRLRMTCRRGSAASGNEAVDRHLKLCPLKKKRKLDIGISDVILDNRIYQLNVTINVSVKGLLIHA